MAGLYEVVMVLIQFRDTVNRELGLAPWLRMLASHNIHTASG